MTEVQRAEIPTLLVRLWGVSALREVMETAPVRKMISLLELLSHEEPDPALVAGAFSRLWEELSSETDPLLPDAWQSRLASSILDSESVFGARAELGEVDSVLLDQASRDLSGLRMLFSLDATTLLRLVGEVVPGSGDMWASWRNPNCGEADSPRRVMARALADADGWEDCADDLARYFRRNGSGMFGCYRAFRWSGGRLVPVHQPDGMKLESFVGYTRERELLIGNTRALVDGRPAHNALLYGAPGTGKSSTVKAVANHFVPHGVRLVEVSKEDLEELPQVLNVLRCRGLKFIVFVDDLSFEEGEVEYKALKALLEGSIESPPRNVRVYATSNRRNLIRETFSEREGDDVHARDTRQEKASLSARFGLRITFPTPDQAEYLEIVRGIVRERGIVVAEEELIERAVAWSSWQSGRSGRSARQFVDELELSS